MSEYNMGKGPQSMDWIGSTEVEDRGVYKEVSDDKQEIAQALFNGDNVKSYSDYKDSVLTLDPKGNGSYFDPTTGDHLEIENWRISKATSPDVDNFDPAQAVLSAGYIGPYLTKIKTAFDGLK